MSDRTAYTIEFTHYDPAKKDQLLQFLDDELGVNESGDSLEHYLVAEHPVGYVQHIATELVDIDSTARFMAWEDPRYEWLGTVVKAIPGKAFVGDCDSEGTVVLSYSWVKKELTSGKTLEQIFGEDVEV